MGSFSISIMVGKAAKSAIKAGVGLVLGFIGADKLASMGIQIDPEALAAGLTVVAIGALEALRNLLKTKLKWSWL